MHIDLDGFFVNASLLSQPPELKEKPCAVAHSAGPTSELASANYPARKYGIKNGMGYKQAIELCPTLKILPYDFALYEKLSNTFYQVECSRIFDPQELLIEKQIRIRLTLYEIDTAAKLRLYPTSQL